MKVFEVKITANLPYPKTVSYRETATQVHVAVGRALAKFKEHVGRKHLRTWKLEVHRLK